MRTLLLTLILAAPLLAQEAEEQEPAKQDKQIEQEIRKTRDKAAEIRKLVETFFEGQDAKRIAELAERLRKLYEADEIQLDFKPYEHTKALRFFLDSTHLNLPGKEVVTNALLPSLEAFWKSIGAPD